MTGAPDAETLRLRILARIRGCGLILSRLARRKLQFLEGMQMDVEAAIVSGRFQSGSIAREGRRGESCVSGTLTGFDSDGRRWTVSVWLPDAEFEPVVISDVGLMQS